MSLASSGLRSLFGGGKPGPRLLKIGVAVYGVSAAILAVLTYGLNYNLENSLSALCLVPIIGFLWGLMMIPGTFMIGYVTGTPAISLTYALGAAKRNWRGVFGVLLMIGVAVSFLVAVL